MITQVHIVTDKGDDKGSKIAKQFGKLRSITLWILSGAYIFMSLSTRLEC